MTKAYEHWKVQPHGTLSRVDDDILTVVGRLRMPLGDFPRRMTVVRLSDARLVIWSAMALDETELAKLEAFGRPAFLVVPNDHHRLDAKAWRNRYPAVAGRCAKRLASKGRASGAGRHDDAGLRRSARALRDRSGHA